MADDGAMRNRVVVGTLIAVVLTVGAVGFYARSESTAPRFCTLGIAGGTVNGATVIYEDQGGPGRDGCDGPEAGRGLGYNVLGFDCKVRDASDKVVAVTTANRSDGTCGQVPNGSSDDDGQP
jgi:hypothetical protein